MGLDINLFRPEKGGNPDLVRESVKKRYCGDPRLVDDIIALDEKWRKKRFECDMLRKQRCVVTREISAMKKLNKDDPCIEEISQDRRLKEQISLLDQDDSALLKELESLLKKVGNIVHPSVPQKDDLTLKTWGTVPDIEVTEHPMKVGSAPHYRILAMIDGVDRVRAQKVSSYRNRYLKGYGGLLNMALYNYGVKFLMDKGYTPMQPPLFMKKNVLAETVDPSAFDEQLYKVIEKDSDDDDEDEEEKKDIDDYGDKEVDLYLISSTEQPLSGLYKNEWLESDQLPIRIAGLSTCFRREKGSYLRDPWGCSQINQFHNVEQFCLTAPVEKSWETLEEMLKNVEEFYQSLKLPYRVQPYTVMVVILKIVDAGSRNLHDAEAKKYFLEAWMPSCRDYLHIVSCVNSTDYKSRELGIRCGYKKQADKEKKYAHILYSTLCATQRTLCIIVENYQTEKGVRVPDVLVPYVGVDFIPYVKFD